MTITAMNRNPTRLNETRINLCNSNFNRKARESERETRECKKKIATIGKKNQR